MAYFAKRLVDTHAFRPIEAVNQFKSCKKIPIIGAEDIVIHPKTGIAYISAVDRRKTMRGVYDSGAGIYAFDMNSPFQKKPEKLKLVNWQEDQEFNPHGIGLMTTEVAENRDFLYVVSHRSTGDVVEIFMLKAGALHWFDTISHPLLHNLNDVVPFGLRQFYATNDHAYFHGKPLAQLFIEDFIPICGANVVLFDGPNNRVERVIDGLCFANGVTISPNKKWVYVSESLTGNLVVAKRAANSTVSIVLRIPTETGVDNIDITPEKPNEILIGSHPNLIAFLKHAIFGGTAPSEVIKVTIQTDDPAKQAVITPETKFKVEAVYRSDGTDLSASSVAARFKNSVLIGPVFDDHILRCELN